MPSTATHPIESGGPATEARQGGPSAVRRRFLAAAAVGLGASAVTAATAHADPTRPHEVKIDLTVKKNLHVDGELVVGGDGTWIDVRAHGAKGDGVTDDTAAIRNAVASLPATGGTLLFPRGSFVVSGEIALADLNSLTVVGSGATLVQQTTFTKTLSFTRVSGLTVRGLEFHGVGTEHDPANTRFNGVAGVYLFDVTDVTVHDCVFRNHAGGAIRWGGALVGADFRSNTAVGIGPDKISRLDNNSDFAIGGYAATKNERVTVTDNDLSGSCFGVGVSGGEGVTITGNRIHDLPGQHGVYLSASSQVVVADNQIHRTAGLGVKNQVAETYAGDVTDNLISGNVFVDCQTAIVVATTSGVAATRHLRNVQISDNVIRSCRESGIYHTAGIDSRICGNSIDDVRYYGIFLNYVSGEINGNTIRRTGYDGIYAVIDDTTVFRDNLFLDAAQNPDGNPADTKWSHHIFVLKSQAARVDRPIALFDSNVHSNPGGEPVSLTRIVRTGSSVGVIWTGVVNLTSRSLQTGTSGDLLYSDVRYAPQDPGTAGGGAGAVTAGRGHREFHASSSPDELPPVGTYAVGDVCWHSTPAATGPLGWVCVGAGAPGVWRPFE